MGELRWVKPVVPARNSSVQDGSYGNQCPNAQINGVNLLGHGSDSSFGPFLDGLFDDVGDWFENVPGDEDCLFLDVYVPGKGLRDPGCSKLPVLHWFYGGGFVLGGKNYVQPVMPFYDGSGYVQQSNNSIIFVASNYRLGAFGWLAGSTMEEQGLPNAGLWDQHAALEWTKNNIGLLGGDGDDITAMGESAGASSILHHLVLEGGKMDPLFRKAVLLSPAYQPSFDRQGTLEEVYQNFTKLAGCSDNSTIACLRAQDSATLIKANMALNAQAIDGTFVVGPSPDGSLIRQCPTLELASGNYWKDMDGLILSHVADESTVFVDGSISNDTQFTSFLGALFPAWLKPTGLDQAVMQAYPPVSAAQSPYASEGDRMRAVVRDSSFTSHIRYLSEAYAGKTWNMQYSLVPGWHATDLVLAFWNENVAQSIVGAALQGFYPNIASISTAYKSYITSLARTGDPNTLRDTTNHPPAIEWPHAQLTRSDNGMNISDVLNVFYNYTLVDDDQAPADAASFWLHFMAAVTTEAGYVPPGALVSSSLLPSANANTSVLQRASRNYAVGKKRASG